MKPNTELEQLRLQMAGVQPDRIEAAMESVAPYATKLLGYVELIKAVLPDARRMAAAVRERSAPPPPQPPPVVEPVRVVVLPPRRSWAARAWTRRPRSWRTGTLLAALPVCAGLAAYVAWRQRR